MRNNLVQIVRNNWVESESTIKEKCFTAPTQIFANSMTKYAFYYGFIPLFCKNGTRKHFVYGVVVNDKRQELYQTILNLRFKYKDTTLAVASYIEERNQISKYSEDEVYKLAERVFAK